MAGGRVLVWILSLLGFFLIAGVVLAVDGASSTPAAPPKARVEVVEETMNGHHVADSYRGLEDPDSRTFTSPRSPREKASGECQLIPGLIPRGVEMGKNCSTKILQMTFSFVQ